MTAEILLGVLIIGLLLFCRIYYETHTYSVTHYSVRNRKIGSLKPYKIAVIADLHNRFYGKGNEKLIQVIKQVNPDIILVAGDLIVSKERKSCETSLLLMEKLGSEYPVFYANGNHEYRWKMKKEFYGDLYNWYTDRLKTYGVHLLENAKYNLKIGEQEVCIYGLELDASAYKRFSKTVLEKGHLEEKLGKADQSKYNILIGHHPSYSHYYGEWGADLSVSGHLHGGMVRLPFFGGVVSPQMEFFPKYSGGMIEDENGVHVISRGLGTHTFNIRLFNKAELVIINLLSDNREGDLNGHIGKTSKFRRPS